MADTAYKSITVAVLVGMLLAGCGGAPQRAVPPADHAYPAPVDSLGDPRRQQVVGTALQALGTPYRYGGNGPRGFDCSGLVQYSHAAAGVAVPRVTTAQRRHARPVALPQLRPGDLLFFELADKGRHVGIYLGDGEFVHAPSSGKRVMVSRLDSPYWQAHLVAAGSYL